MKQFKGNHCFFGFKRYNNMKQCIKQALAFLLVWFCSGTTMYAYQTENKILGLSFTFLSFLYWLILKDER